MFISRVKAEVTVEEFKLEEGKFCERIKEEEEEEEEETMEEAEGVGGAE